MECVTHPVRVTYSIGAYGRHDKGTASETRANHFDDLAQLLVAQVCHEHHESHALGILAQEHSRCRVMLASLYDGPMCAIATELNQDQVVFRDS